VLFVLIQGTVQMFGMATYVNARMVGWERTVVSQVIDIFDDLNEVVG